MLSKFLEHELDDGADALASFKSYWDFAQNKFTTWKSGDKSEDKHFRGYQIHNKGQCRDPLFCIPFRTFDIKPYVFKQFIGI